MGQKLAPIVLFAFNRLESLKSAVTSLLSNSEAAESVIHIYVDGARESKEGERQKVEAVQQYVRSIEGFKELHYIFSDENKGLGESIIGGVTEVINRYGRAIVLEDDLVVAPNFLSFMNNGLDRYEDLSKVFSICGYTNQVKPPKGYNYDIYFCSRSSSWGWATWADRWNTVDWKLDNWDLYKDKGRAFNRWGGSDCFRMLRSVRFGEGDSWAIRFCFAQFLQDKLSLFPVVSRVKCDGFGGDGTNCKGWSRFKCEFDMSGRKTLRQPDDVVVDEQLYRSAMSYHSVAIRLYSRLMYILHP